MSSSLTKVCLAVLSCMVLAGCNSKPYNLAPISGVVTLDGNPIAGTLVNFQPMAKEGTAPGPGSTGRCDESGRYVLSTIRDEAGAVIGKHQVRIYSYSPESPVSQDTDAGLPREQFPSRYNYGSELVFEVERGGTEAADFKLTTANE